MKTEFAKFIGQRDEELKVSTEEYWAKFTFHLNGKIKMEPDKLIENEKAQPLNDQEKRNTKICQTVFLDSLGDYAVAEIQLRNPKDIVYIKDLWWIKQKWEENWKPNRKHGRRIVSSVERSDGILNTGKPAKLEKMNAECVAVVLQTDKKTFKSGGMKQRKRISVEAYCQKLRQDTRKVYKCLKNVEKQLSKQKKISEKVVLRCFRCKNCIFQCTLTVFCQFCFSYGRNCNAAVKLRANHIKFQPEIQAWLFESSN